MVGRLDEERVERLCRRNLVDERLSHSRAEKLPSRTPSRIAAIPRSVSSLIYSITFGTPKNPCSGAGAFATSFQPAGVVILHLAKTAGLPIQAFTLNTGLLFPETLEFKAKLEAHLGIKVEAVLPAQTVEQQAAQYGAELWKRDPEKCCELRKVDSLGKKLFDLDLWITGMRRDQSAERSVTPLLSLAARPDNSDVWKLNPLVDWSRDQVWAYLKEHGLPHNVLHDRGYRSIGCLPLHPAHLRWRRTRRPLARLRKEGMRPPHPHEERVGRLAAGGWRIGNIQDPTTLRTSTPTLLPTAIR